ncbi:MAG TPA: hypothetical protein P5139_00035, partial [Tenuifilum sp.]|nr:hypothetical protein [Tenuifilum sp.]
MKYVFSIIALTGILLTVTFCKEEETVKPIGNIMVDSITIDGIKVYDNGQINHIGFKPNIKV